jgi:hypothetical protein
VDALFDAAFPESNPPGCAFQAEACRGVAGVVLTGIDNAPIDQQFGLCETQL